MAGKRKSSGGIKGIFTTIVAVAVVGGLAFGWLKANDITTVDGFFDKVRSSSDRINECSGNKIEWNCETKGSGSGKKPSITPPANSGETAADVEKFIKDKANVASNLVPGDPIKGAKYDRKNYKHWLGGRCDNVREQTLKRDAESFKLDKENCKVAKGVWNDVYTGQKLTSPSQIQIDHIVALAYIDKYGGANWTAEKREAIANDPENILAVDGPENQSKSNKGPSKWMVPKNEAYACTFAAKFTNVVAKYDLRIPASDIRALEKQLSRC